MTKFRVPMTITFNGAVEVEADTEEQAEIIAKLNVIATMGDVFADEEHIKNHSFDVYGHGERKENESIEEIEEE